jgi:hypothetical protein
MLAMKAGLRETMPHTVAAKSIIPDVMHGPKPAMRALMPMVVEAVRSDETHAIRRTPDRNDGNSAVLRHSVRDVKQTERQAKERHPHKAHGLPSLRQHLNVHT